MEVAAEINKAVSFAPKISETETEKDTQLKEWNEKRLEAYLTCSDYGDAILKGGLISDAFLRRKLRQRQHDPESEKFTNWKIELGKDNEGLAVELLAKRYDKTAVIKGENVKLTETIALFNVFKFSRKIKGFGGSPDFEIYNHTENGLCAKVVEMKKGKALVTDCVSVPLWVGDTKCASSSEMFGEYCTVTDWDSLKKFKKAYYYQLVGQLIVTGAKGAIFAAFCPEIYAMYQKGIERLTEKETLTDAQIERYTEWSRYKFLHVVELGRDEELIAETEIFIKAAITRMKELKEDELFEK